MKTSLLIGICTLLLSPLALAHHGKDVTEQWPVTEKSVLTCIHHANQMEITMGQLAQQSGQSQWVRDYGARLVADHTQADSKVMQTAREEGVTVETTALADEEVTDLNNLRSLNGVQFDKAFVNQMMTDHKAVIRELDYDLGQLPSSSRTRSLVSALLPTLRDHKTQATTVAAELGSPSDQERLPASE